MSTPWFASRAAPPDSVIVRWFRAGAGVDDIAESVPGYWDHDTGRRAACEYVETVLRRHMSSARKGKTR